MCFVLYLASKSRAPLIPWDPGKPALCVEDHGEALRLDKSRFTLPKVVYVGSDQQCGCGFRSLSFQEGGWPGDWMAQDPDYEPPKGSQANHEQLAEYLRKHFAEEDFVELYGCWSGDEGERLEKTESIPLVDIVGPQFHFKERALYRVEGLGARPRD